ncbi:MAG: nitroreductase family protein [Lachnospiraceae bacterium]|nr:nitroreductase family protein [Lachnospiraceae bacterium]
MDFLELAKKRYSCKKFDSRKVEREKLEAILEAGRLAPTAKNMQEQHIYVLESEESLAKVDKASPCRYGAPTVLAVAYDKNMIYTYPGGKRTSDAEDAVIVATHLMLAAADAGVDSCYLNCFDPELMEAELGVPENEEIVMLLDLGYAAEGAGPLPNHDSRKPLSETVTYM